MKVDEHASHPIGVVDHVVDKRPLPLTFACIVQSPAAVDATAEAGADPDAGGGMLVTEYDRERRARGGAVGVDDSPRCSRLELIERAARFRGL